MNKNKIGVGLAKFYLRYGRGSELTNFLLNIIKFAVYLGGLWYLIKEWFGFDFSKWVVICFSIIYTMSCYFIGLLDEKMGFWKIQGSYASKELNPFFKEMDEKINKLTNK